MINRREKLIKRIRKEFSKKEIIGDIFISDDEYSELESYFKDTITNLELGKSKQVDRTFAVALVQIGIRHYDGKFWPHLERIGVFKSQLTNTKVRELFNQTMKFYHKILVDEHEFVNSVLMHGFVSDNYIKNLFDYLFHFYTLDIGRNMNRETFEPALKFLVEIIKEEDPSLYTNQTNRKYMLIKQTSDVIRLSSKASIISRFRWLIKTIDKLSFGDPVNYNSKSRLIRAFIKYFEKKREETGFSIEKRTRGSVVTNRAPYIRYKHEKFEVYIPERTILARNGSNITASISIGDRKEELDLLFWEQSTLIKTKEHIKRINSDDIFQNISIELNVGITKSQLLILNGKPIVFFDKDFESLRSDSKKQTLTEGTIYAFIKNDVEVEKTSFEYSLKELNEFKMLFFEAERGDFIKIGGQVYSLNYRHDENINQRFRIEYCSCGGNDVYNHAPILNFRTKKNKLDGIILRINGSPYHLSNVIYEEFINEDGAGYILLDEYIKKSGVYNIELDIPEQRLKHYNFAIFNDFKLEFDNTPYIFKSEGLVEFINGDVSSELESNEGLYRFNIDDNLKQLDFEYLNDGEKILFQVHPPILRRKLEDESFTVEPIGEIWHELFDYYMDIVFSEQYSIEVNNDYSNGGIINSSKKADGLFHCDLTPLRTWLFQTTRPYSKIEIKINSNTFELAKVFIKTQVIGVSNFNYNEQSKSIEILVDKFGNDNVYVTVIHESSQLIVCENKLLSESLLSIEAENLAGLYSFDFYIREKGFGKNFKSIYSKKLKLITDSLAGVTLLVYDHYLGDFRFEVHKYRSKTYINNLKQINKDIYEGELYSLVSDKSNRKVSFQGKIKVEILGYDRYYKSNLYFIEEFEGDIDYLPLLYDKTYKQLVFEEVTSISRRESYKRYSYLDNAIFDLDME